jgi:preprotein translocase subunit SecG
MSIFLSIVLVVQVLSALAVVVLVLLQHGKGADMGASFGSGASGSLFGATGSANFLSRTTGVLAAIFFASTLALAFVGNQRNSATGSSVLDRVLPAKEAPKDAAKDAAKDAPKADPSKGEIPKADAPKVEVPKVEAPKAAPDAKATETKPVEIKPADVKPAESKPIQNTEVPK